MIMPVYAAEFVHDAVFRDIEDALGDPYYGGTYTEDGTKVICVVETMAEEAPEFPAEILVRYVRYSYNELNDCYRELSARAYEEGALFADCQVSAVYPSYKRNRVVVEFEQAAEQSIALFKETISDSPMLYFEGGVDYNADVAEGTPDKTL